MGVNTIFSLRHDNFFLHLHPTNLNKIYNMTERQHLKKKLNY